MLLFYILIFLISCALFYFSGDFVVGGLTRMARFLGWREFTVAFLVMAFAGSLPNLFVGISSALHKIPQLSFGDVVGGNVVDLTLAVALAVLFTKNGVPAESRMVQTSSIFTIIIALLPLVLVADGILGRGDGLLLIGAYLAYNLWLFSKKERFAKIYDSEKRPVIKGFKIFLRDLGRLAIGIIFLLLAAEGIVRSASFFSVRFDLPIPLIGILIVGLGNALSEIAFSIASARRGESWMILGDLMGSVIVCATLVLGVVALIYPIEISDFSPFAIARFFLIISAVFFMLFVRTNRKITKKEAVFLLAVYFLFVLVEIFSE